MPLKWDYSDTRVAKEKDEDEEMAELWETLTESHGGETTCAECGYDYDEEADISAECPECGETEKRIRMSWDFYTTIPLGVYNELGGEYGNRGKEMLEGETYTATKEVIKKTLRKTIKNPEKYEDFIEDMAEGLEGFEVWATR